jgi:hypothetical protein
VWQGCHKIGEESSKIVPLGAPSFSCVRSEEILYRTFRRHSLHFRAKRVVERLQSFFLQIEVSKIIIHKAHQPNVVVDFFDADGLAGKDLAEIDFLLAQTDAPAAGDHDSFIVEGIVDVRQAGVGARGRLVDLRGTLHVQSLVRTLLVEDLDEVIELGLLLKKV